MWRDSECMHQGRYVWENVCVSVRVYIYIYIYIYIYTWEDGYM